MWTKRNDHALKNECIDFFLIYLQNASVELKKDRKKEKRKTKV